MPRCEKCGAELPENVTICSKCCTGLNRPADVNYMVSDANKAKGSDKKYKLIIIALSAALVLLIVILLSVLFVPKILEVAGDKTETSTEELHEAVPQQNIKEEPPIKETKNEKPEKDNPFISGGEPQHNNGGAVSEPEGKTEASNTKPEESKETSSKAESSQESTTAAEEKSSQIDSPIKPSEKQEKPSADADVAVNR